MHTEFLMGNAAIAMGAIAAGLNVVSGYPGTPSTEVLETTAKHNDGSIYVEWSTNEKAAMELAAGAAYCGARTMVTMKQVGLNVASDPLMSLAYIGVKGGMVILWQTIPGRSPRRPNRIRGGLRRSPSCPASTPPACRKPMT